MENPTSDILDTQGIQDTQYIPPILVPEPELHPVPTSTPTSDKVKNRKPRGPDKKPRKKKSDTLNQLLEGNNGSEGSSTPLEDDVMVEVRKIMDYLLDSIAPKKRKRGPNKNPRAKRMKLEEGQETEPKLEPSDVAYSFPGVSVPKPQQSMSFVMKTVEELVQNWNFNNYILGIPYQLANPNTPSLNGMIQEATQRIHAFNQLTNPSSSTYDPTLSSLRKDSEVAGSGGPMMKVEPSPVSTPSSVKTPISTLSQHPPKPLQHHGGPPMNPQMQQNFHMQMNPAWQQMSMMHTMQHHQQAAMMSMAGKPPIGPMQAQFQAPQNLGPSTPHQSQLKPVRPHPKFVKNSMASQHPKVPMSPMPHTHTNSSNPALQAQLQRSQNPGASTPHQAQMDHTRFQQPMHHMIPMTHPYGSFDPAQHAQAQQHAHRTSGAPIRDQCQSIPVRFQQPMHPMNPMAHPTGFPGHTSQSQTQLHGCQNLGAPSPHPSIQGKPEPIFPMMSQQPMFSIPNPVTYPSGPSAHALQAQNPPFFRQNLGSPASHQSQKVLVKPEPSFTRGPVANPTGSSAYAPQAHQNFGAPTLSQPTRPMAQPTGSTNPALQSQPTPSQMSYPSGSSNPAAGNNPITAPLTPLTIQNLLSHTQSHQSQAPQCTSSGRTTATLTPGLNAISDSSNNSSPTFR